MKKDREGFPVFFLLLSLLIGVGLFILMHMGVTHSSTVLNSTAGARPATVSIPLLIKPQAMT